MFSEIAGTYDLLNHVLSANQDRRWRRRAVSLLCPRRGEHVLDLCCGTGDLGLEVLRRQPGCRLTGADFALPMLQLAHQKYASRGLDRQVPFIAADALVLPFADASFHAVTVGFGARNWTDTAAGLREVHRVLRPGGRLLVLEFMRPNSSALHTFYCAFSSLLAPLGRCVSGHTSAYRYLPQSVEGFCTRREFEQLLCQAGFGNIRSFNYFGGVATAFLSHVNIMNDN